MADSVMTNRVPELPARDAFLHVIYEHRYFSLAAAAWQAFGPSGACGPRGNDLLPGISVLVQDSLLAHARALIDFYVNDNPRGTDVVLADFGLGPLSNSVKGQVARFKEPIEVHLLHITAYRDVAYRQAAASMPTGLQRQRIDWDGENPQIIDALLDALDTASRTPGADWCRPFQLLHSSASALRSNPAAPWPTDLTEAADVSAYLTSAGL